jgi:hypothetical protein
VVNIPETWVLGSAHPTRTKSNPTSSPIARSKSLLQAFCKSWWGRAGLVEIYGIYRYLLA